MSRRTGTQSIERAAQLLRELASRGQLGWRLKDLSDHIGLERTTTYRTLACLVRQGLAHQRSVDRKYVPGPLLFELSLSMPYVDFLSACRPSLARLSRAYGCTAILNLRSGSDVVCAMRLGKELYPGTALHVGTRRPLTCTAAGIAVLSVLPKPEARLIAQATASQMKHYGRVTATLLEKMLRRSEALGYTFSQITPGLHSFSLPLMDRTATVFGALTVSNYADRFPEERSAEIVSSLRNEAHEIERHRSTLFDHVI